MASDRLLRFVFILYCTSVGGVLVTLPWSVSWNIMSAHLPLAVARWLEEPMFRGLISGFGLVHLVWALHDTAQLTRPHDVAPTRSSATLQAPPSTVHETPAAKNPGDQ